MNETIDTPAADTTAEPLATMALAALQPVPAAPLSRPCVWAIATSDSAGAAGIQADTRTLTDLNTHACSVITAITGQNTQTVSFHQALDATAIGAQLQALDIDLPARAIKIGALPNLAALHCVRDYLQHIRDVSLPTQPSSVPTVQPLTPSIAPPVIADPVLVTSSGSALISAEGLAHYHQLYPYLTLLTPNLRELEILSGHRVQQISDVKIAATRLLQQGLPAILVKGGHQRGDLCQDYFCDGKREFWLTNARQHTRNSRGTGCTLASAISAFMAHGKPLIDAIVLANAYVQQGLRLGYSLGDQRPGPLGTGGWPTRFEDFPQVGSSPEQIFQPAFATCDTLNLGLYPVVDSVEWVEKLLQLGVKTLQLRVKNMDPVALDQMIQRAVALGKQAHARLFINDYWRHAIKHGAYGVHLGQEDLDSADLAAIREAGLHLGISTHSEYEWARAATLKPSYLAIGAIFPTQTKSVIEVGTQNLSTWAQILTHHFPLVAIGGINLGNIEDVLKAPVGSVAVVSAITAASDYERATKALLKLIADTTRHPIQGRAQA